VLRFVTHCDTRSVVALGLSVVLVLLAAASVRSAAPQPVITPAIRAALDTVRGDERQVTSDQVRLCEIPAPAFKEGERAQAMRASFEQLGLANVRVDKAGNVLGERPGTAASPHVVIAAHLDTVFPEGTDVRVRRNGSVLSGPGIGDDCRGLAVLLAVVRTLKRAGLSNAGPMTFVASVGEEGLGDLRGMRQLFGDTLKGRVDRFMAIDGAGLFVVNKAVGSRRYRMTFKGPGGHSYTAFGAANPIQAMGRAIEKISRLEVGRDPKTTFNIGRVGGGTSVNAIPSECWMEVDLRSSDARSLMSLDSAVQHAVDEGVREENQRGGVPRAITVAKQLVGDRPAGETPLDSSIVQTALAAGRALGLSLTPLESSTDANVPIHLGIPAITIGTGGAGTAPHTTGERYDTAEAWRGTQYAVLTTLLLAKP
jgi:acetylornithine deacetylase/succinyl-diaminopimelate desuccinylase-like protein